jgi:uncharacterized protein
LHRAINCVRTDHHPTLTTGDFRPEMAKGTYQVAAVPVRRGSDGSVQVLLVTSRETHRWVVPKGWPWPTLADHLAAAEEAWEEAGVRGLARAALLGTFSYDKRGRKKLLPLTVSVYALDVVDEFETWPEQDERRRAWFTVADAADAVDEPELKQIILAFEAATVGRPS